MSAAHPSSPRALVRPAAVLCAAYLAVTLPALLSPPRALGLLAAHVALLAAALWSAAHAPRDVRPPALAAWLPLLAVPLCYAELPRVAGAMGHTVLHDATVLRWEVALFGVSPAQSFAERWPVPALSELLHLGYLSYYLLIYVPPAWLWWRAVRGSDARPFTAAVFSVWLTFVVCYVVFVALPVQGPWYQWPAPVAVPDGPIRAMVQTLLRAGSSRGTAFPSSHVAVAVAHTLALTQLAPRAAPIVGAATLLLAAGAVYGGFHYGVDVVAGALLGAVIGAVGPRLHTTLVARA